MSRDPLIAGFPRNLYYRALSIAMRTVGRTSDGIAIGLTHGFDSGSMLDHVHENQAGGRLLIGRLVDRGLSEHPRVAGDPLPERASGKRNPAPGAGAGIWRQRHCLSGHRLRSRTVHSRGVRDAARLS